MNRRNFFAVVGGIVAVAAIPSLATRSFVERIYVDDLHAFGYADFDFSKTDFTVEMWAKSDGRSRYRDDVRITALSPVDLNKVDWRSADHSLWNAVPHDGQWHHMTLVRGRV